ncbi:putative fbd-associated F-box protein at5g56440 [Phtheirospermum japonicum]|uniref:Putative fbd-associated F-box protein at5g56440 n=1 Tax=Phtheirospermum japonicum TaxID=374723 RepID=A0A830C1H6_9LAMI|nr:putative fbd-associated F-box protein at5g56440 [Phtheirospermum japonicum]
MELPEQSKALSRLSALPDNLIRHILSFLPTKLSVATSLLARRWRFLWAHVPNLDFAHKDDQDTEFPNSVHKIMLLHKVQNLNTFRLSCMDYCDEHHLQTWIATAIARNVQNILLHLTVKLPRCLFTCQTLLYLSLNSC